MGALLPPRTRSLVCAIGDAAVLVKAAGRMRREAGNAVGCALWLAGTGTRI